MKKAVLFSILQFSSGPSDYTSIAYTIISDHSFFKCIYNKNSIASTILKPNGKNLVEKTYHVKLGVSF